MSEQQNCEIEKKETEEMNENKMEEDKQEPKKDETETGIVDEVKKENMNEEVGTEMTTSVNDNHGHEAGDRLIIGAARCIEQCFKDRGRLYRIGGDEFVVLLDAKQEEVERLTDDVKQRAATWSEEEDVKLTISCGAAGAPEFPEDDISELARTADERMYQEKARYYQSIGMERRRRRIKAAD